MWYVSVVIDGLTPWYDARAVGVAYRKPRLHQPRLIGLRRQRSGDVHEFVDLVRRAISTRSATRSPASLAPLSVIPCPLFAIALASFVSSWL